MSGIAKRLTAVLLAMAMVITLLPVMGAVTGGKVGTKTAYAAANGTCGDNLTWTLDDEGTLTISGDGAMDTYEAFDKGNPTEGSSPWSVLGLEDKIKKVAFDGEITYIGSNAFRHCSNLKDITIPESVEELGSEVFYDCDSLTEFVFTDTVYDCGASVLEDCANLETVTLGANVYPYNICSGENYSIKTINVSKLNESIMSAAFGRYYALENINVEEGNEKIFSRDGVLFNIDLENIWLNTYPRGKSNDSYSIPDDINAIGYGAFYGSNLTELKIPVSVKRIDDQAITSCDKLADVYYSGTKDEWNAIQIGKRNYSLENATMHYEGEPEEPITITSVTLKEKEGSVFSTPEFGQTIPQPPQVVIESVEPSEALNNMRVESYWQKFSSNTRYYDANPNVTFSDSDWFYYVEIITDSDNFNFNNFPGTIELYGITLEKSYSYGTTSPNVIAYYKMFTVKDPSKYITNISLASDDELIMPVIGEPMQFPKVTVTGCEPEQFKDGLSAECVWERGSVVYRQREDGKIEKGTWASADGYKTLEVLDNATFISGYWDYHILIHNDNDGIEFDTDKVPETISLFGHSYHYCTGARGFSYFNLQDAYPAKNPPEQQEEKKSIKSATVTVSNVVYNGKPQTPAPIVKDGSKTLVKGTDYDLEYSNNTNVGIATVKIAGKGNYTGSTNKSFRVQFTDMPNDPKNPDFDKAIFWAVDNGITNGWDDGTFRPWKSINRAAVVTFLWRAKGRPEPQSIAKFSDMPENNAKNQDFRKAISWAAERGITTGFSDGTFRPWDECNRAAIATFIWRSEGKPAASKTATFKDMTGNSDFDKAISWGVSKGIISGWSDNTFRPWRNCNRAATVTFLYRLKGK